MPKNLRITLMQQPLVWENPQANLIHFTNLINKIKTGSSDVIVLPEMFTTGFTMNATHLAETKGGLAMSWMAEVAKEKKMAICGSVMMKEGRNIYNQFVWMSPDMTYSTYNKRHLFRMGKEHEVFAAGDESVLIAYKGWNICPLVCYDLRFPVWSRNRLAKADAKTNLPEYDILLYVANWPEVRRFAWKQLLIARAIENQCYVVGVNRVGIDGNGMKHKGDSVVLNYVGTKISKIPTSRPSFKTVVLDAASLTKYRKSFPALMDADQFIIR